MPLNWLRFNKSKVVGNKNHNQETKKKVTVICYTTGKKMVTSIFYRKGDFWAGIHFSNQTCDRYLTQHCTHDATLWHNKFPWLHMPYACLSWISLESLKYMSVWPRQKKTAFVGWKLQHRIVFSSSSTNNITVVSYASWWRKRYPHQETQF